MNTEPGSQPNGCFTAGRKRRTPQARL